MAADKQGRRPNELGAVGRHLAANLAKIRDRVSTYELSRRLTDLGRPIPASGITKIEAGLRRVDADDLLALAVALGVHPVDLLVPSDLADDEPYNVTPSTETTAARAREWISGLAFLVEPENGYKLMQALRSLPARRGAELSGRWWASPERQMEQTRATNKAFPPELPDDPDERLQKTDPPVWLAMKEGRVVGTESEGGDSGSDDGTETA